MSKEGANEKTFGLAGKSLVIVACVVDFEAADCLDVGSEVIKSPPLTELIELMVSLLQCCIF